MLRKAVLDLNAGLKNFVATRSAAVHLAPLPVRQLGKSIKPLGVPSDAPTTL